MASPVKGLIILGVVGATTGGGILIRNHLYSSTKKRFKISELISKSKTKIAVSKSEEWNKLGTKYQKDNEGKGTKEDFWKLPEGKSKTDPQSIPSSYKQKCSSLSNEEVDGEDDSKYLEFLNKCARSKTVGDLLAGSTLLSSESVNDTKGQKRFKAYKTAKVGTDYPIKGIALDNNDLESNSEHVDKLRNGCATQGSNPVTGDEEQKYLDAVKTGCSAEITTNDN